MLSDDVAVVVLLVIVEGKAAHVGEVLLFARDLYMHQPDEMVNESELFLDAQSNAICFLERE